MADWKEKRRSEYAEKLKDPRWQKLRLQVFARDEWACRVCGSKERTLAVHHFYYEPDAEPWEYPLDAFLTVCENCHDAEYAMRPDNEAGLLDLLRKSRFFCYDVFILEMAVSLSGPPFDYQELRKRLKAALEEQEPPHKFYAEYLRRMADLIDPPEGTQ